MVSTMPPTGISVTVRVISRPSPEGVTARSTLAAVAGTASRAIRIHRSTALLGVTMGIRHIVINILLFVIFIKP
jgi:hypothetical protein